MQKYVDKRGMPRILNTKTGVDVLNTPEIYLHVDEEPAPRKRRHSLIDLLKEKKINFFDC